MPHRLLRVIRLALLALCCLKVSGFTVNDLTGRVKSRRMEPSPSTRIQLQSGSDEGQQFTHSPDIHIAVNGESSPLQSKYDEIQKECGPDSARLVPKEEDGEDVRASSSSVRTINSLVFSVTTPPSSSSPDKRLPHNAYILAILQETDIVSRSALQDAVQRILQRNDLLVRLAPSNKVLAMCGYTPGTIPPIGLSPGPLLTLVEESQLLAKEEDDDKDGIAVILRGGGGSPDASCLISMDALLQQPNVHTASFRRQPWPRAASPTSSQDLSLQSTHKPYFALAPPNMEVVRQVLAASSTDNNPLPFTPEPFAIVGRIRIIRRMARQLAFCDLGPPVEATIRTNAEEEDDTTDIASNNSTLHLPWRCPTTDQDMAVQLIFGKTLCQRLGNEQGTATIKSLRVGDVVLVQGMTNVHVRDSLNNWVDKACFDLVVWSVQMLVDGSTMSTSLSMPKKQPSRSNNRLLPRPPSRPTPGMSYLSIQDLYGGAPDDEDNDDDGVSSVVTVVDTSDSLQAFAADVTILQSTLAAATNGEPSTGLVGLDTEWRPSFLYSNPNEPQVVLLLQVCLHPLKRVYVLDLQALLRPLRPLHEPMNSLEASVSQCIGEMFASRQLFKVGFQLTNDLRRLAASYPHIPAFREIHSVLETSTLAKTVMRLQKLGNLREVMSSLSRLTEKFIGKTINKDNQCSDWSLRPLTAEQIEYAALDALVTPCLVEKLLVTAQATIQFDEKPKVGRWKDDSSFTGCISSMRFLFLDADADPIAIRKLSAKRVIGSPYIVSQFWPTGNEPPQLPTLPSESDGEYTGVDGVLRVPSRIVSLQRSDLDDLMVSMLGEPVGKSKERCLSLLLKGEAALPDGAKLEFPQRSGFVEFENAVALFVNMPVGGRGNTRSYPNEWRNDGQTLTWFLRESDWKQGTSPLARKLQGDKGSDPSSVILFVRSGDGHFICCGFCEVESEERLHAETLGEAIDDESSSRDWELVQLNLHLVDHEKLKACRDFALMMAQADR